MPSAGEIITAGAFTAGLDAVTDRVDFLEFGAPTLRAATGGSPPSTISVPTGTEVAIPFQVAPYNIGGIHPGGTATTLTIPRDGVYGWEGYALYTTIDTVGIRALRLRRNGVADFVALNPEGLGGATTPANVRATAFFGAGETVQALTWQDSGSTLQMLAWITATWLRDIP
jgi:hypothetical protein